METCENVFEEIVPQGKGMLCVLDQYGDTKLIWDSANEAEIENARRTFDDLVKKGFHAFSVKKDGSAGKKLTEFDPDTEKIIMIPQLAGG